MHGADDKTGHVKAYATISAVNIAKNQYTKTCFRIYRTGQQNTKAIFLL